MLWSTTDLKQQSKNKNIKYLKQRNRWTCYKLDKSAEKKKIRKEER